MAGRITDVRGVSVGHAQNAAARTGCSVVLTPGGAVVGVTVRGSASATRETELCHPGTLVQRAHAVLLTGGSAFGLDAATGVMRYLHELDVGFETGIVRVPIVPGAALFDLGVGLPVAPDAAMGYAACQAAGTEVAEGAVGAGTGATVGKVLGIAASSPSGIGTASLHVGGVTVGALVAVNAVGNVCRPDTSQIVAGVRSADDGFLDAEDLILRGAGLSPLEATTIGVVATDAVLDADAAAYLARAAFDGLVRTIRPVATMYDGDTIFALATGESGETLDSVPLGVAAARVLAEAVVRAVESRGTSVG